MSVLRITEVTARVVPVATRIPFRYGIAEMTRAPHVVVQLRTETPTGGATGWSSEHLPPKWFIKDATLPFAEEVAILSRAILAALDAARGIQAEHAFAFVHELDPVLQHGGQDAGGTVRGRRHHAAARGVLFVDGEGVRAEPVSGERGLADPGIQLLAEIRQLPAYQAIPIVILSRLAKEREAAVCFRLGATAYVEKASNFHAFFHAIKALVTHWLQ